MIPAATAPGELVLNGMSLASRKAPFANAGLVAEVRPSDEFFLLLLDKIQQV